MKKIAQSFAVLMLSALFFSAQANVLLFEEGKHYEVIGQTASSKPNITEFFSFYCPHCFKFEFIAEGIEHNLPENVTFKKSHVDFLRAASPETQHALTRAMVTAQKLKVGHKMVKAIFEHIHTQKQTFTGEADIRKLFVANGIDGKQFDSAMKSFGVKGAANQMKKAQDTLSAKRALTGVPMFVVNDKYKILSKELRSLEDYNALVQFLLSKD
ncbi:MAG: thiol:disulfide interchange protein DsbA [Phenylobacterium sp.]|jgi:thiol:disulfide interchange protein DsbA